MMKTFVDAIQGERSLYCWRVTGDQQSPSLSDVEERIWRKIFHGFKSLSQHPDLDLRQSRFTVHAGSSTDRSTLLIGIDAAVQQSLTSFLSGLLAEVSAPGHPKLLTTPAEGLLTPHYRYHGGSLKSYRCDAEDVGNVESDERYGTGLPVTFYELVDPSFLNAPEEYNNED